MNPSNYKSFRCASDADPFTIAKLTGPVSCDKAAAGDTLLGTFDSMGATAGGMADIPLGGLPEVRLGGTVAVDAPLTADANGKAVAVAAGETAFIIGYAMAAGDDGQIIPYRYAAGWVTVPAA
jgi:hypothetical protein